MTTINTLTITITEACDGEGFFYGIYDCEADQVEDHDELDGGQCTSDDIRDAIEMASAQACELLVNLDNKKND